MQKRKKIGGFTDRRIGENNPEMTPEERALERFVKEKQRNNRKSSAFDLEEAEDDFPLTHGGMSLSLEPTSRIDDFIEEISDVSGQEEEDPREGRLQKRRRLSKTDSSGDETFETQLQGPDQRPKTKNEVMSEVINKSKLYKYERQQVKEDDDKLRAELDEGLPDLYQLVRGNFQASQTDLVPEGSKHNQFAMNPDRLALLNGEDRSRTDKEYDARLRQMALDRRAKPTQRTLTAEEKAQVEADRLREMEEKRLMRMKGISEESDPGGEGTGADDNPDEDREDLAFALGTGLDSMQDKGALEVEEEDEFLIEDDLVASDLDSDASSREISPSPGEDPSDADFEAEFLDDLLTSSRSKDHQAAERPEESEQNLNGKLAYTYPCPSNLETLIEIMKDVSEVHIPTVVQRIRTLHQPQLAEGNKEKLGGFAQVLVQYTSYLADQETPPAFSILETLIRHIHSLAKTFPVEVGSSFRDQLSRIHEQHPTAFEPGDLVLLTAIGSIFPTSDHFHQVVTPAMLCMTRYLEQKAPASLSDLSTGLFVCSLCIHFQRLAGRYIPEALNYVVMAFRALLPVELELGPIINLNYSRSNELRMKADPEASDIHKVSAIPTDFWNVTTRQMSQEQSEGVKRQLFHTLLGLINSMLDLWLDKPAFCEMFDPAYKILQSTCNPAYEGKLGTDLVEEAQELCTKLHVHLLASYRARQPLRLHNHRPRPIKTFIPKFEDSYNPERHYDHDRDRAELTKLKVEHKKERKGALRELRKDANFLARESLREKRERDAAYEKKYKRLVAEIQGEEGREAKLYEKEKKSRKGRKRSSRPRLHI